MEMLVEHGEQAPAGGPHEGCTHRVARPFAGLIATGAEPLVAPQVPLATMALLAGYADVVDMLVALEPHIVRGDQ